MKPYQRYFLSIFILSTNGKERENISPGRIQTTLKVVEHVRVVKHLQHNDNQKDGNPVQGIDGHMVTQIR